MASNAESLVKPTSGDLPAAAVAKKNGHAKTNGHVKTNGHANGATEVHADDLHELLHAMQAMRLGDFSVRLPDDHTGLTGKIADVFNEIIAANERMAHQLEQVGQIVGREGKTRRRVKFAPCSIHNGHSLLPS